MTRKLWNHMMWLLGRVNKGIFEKSGAAILGQRCATSMTLCREQDAYTFPVMDATNRLTKEWRN